ncbi:MAG: hypothetical protein OEY86_04015 [Nitrospira sp.]|nr:hypothetical protein [Nitrospira sp.]
MMSFTFLIRAVVCLMVLALGTPLAARAQHGHELAANTCVIHMGPYKMYFSSYQPDTHHEHQFCQELPDLGNTVVVLDFVERELRSVPVEFRIIRDTGSEQDLEAITLVHFSPKLYPKGSIDVKHNFEQPGKFIVLVSVGDNQEHLSRFHFSVGELNPISHLQHYMVVLFPLGVAIAIAVYYGLRDRRKSSPPTASS